MLTPAAKERAARTERTYFMRKTMIGLAALGIVGAAALTLGLSAGAGETRPLGELLRATHVHGLAVDRADPGRLLIATHHGLHALRLEDGTVVPVAETRDDFMGFTPHPEDPDTLYASGHPAGGGNLGFIASADGGKTWEQLSPGAGGPVDFHQMDVSKADPSVIYGAYGGIQLSRDGGRSWEKVGPAPDGLIDLAASAENADRLYAATREGLLVSQDGGASWQRMNLPRRPVSLVEVSGNGTIHAFVLGHGLLQGREGASDWRTLNNDFGDRYLLHLAVDPANSARLFAVTQESELMASEDGGRNWRLLGKP